MTFSEIVAEVADRCDLSSATALTRIGREVNERYRWLASSVGFSTIQTKLGVVATTVMGNRSLVFGASGTPVEKLLVVYNAAYTPPQVLGQISMDQMRNQIPGTDPPQQYAIQLMGDHTVTIYLGSIPGSAYDLTADVLSNLTTLAGSDVPAFTEDYHDLLVYGVMGSEYLRMEKADLARVYDNENERAPGLFQVRCAQLRYYIQKSAYMDIYQARTGGYSPFPVPLVQ